MADKPKYYYSFNEFLQEKFGCRVHRLSLNAGFLCPNLDGTLSFDGCVFCNNKAFSHFTKENISSIEEQIRLSMEYSSKRFKAKKFIAYFQSFTNTYSNPAILKQRYDIIRKFPDIVGLSISTRPDCIDKEKLDLIESYTDDYMVWIEYGLQTVHSEGLKSIRRNHDFSDFEKAVELTRRRKGINIACHVILGLWTETKDDMLSTAEKISAMPLSGLKFHCLHVLKDTFLQKLHQKEELKFLSEDEYVDILVSFLELIPKEFVVLRVISGADREFLIAPLWINDKQRLLNKIRDEFIRRASFQGSRINKLITS